MDPARIIAALEHELAGYVQRGLADRADQVAQELRRLGRSTPTIAETVPPEPASTPQKPTTSVTKPVERVKDAEGIKTPKTTKKRS